MKPYVNAELTSKGTKSGLSIYVNEPNVYMAKTITQKIR